MARSNEESSAFLKTLLLQRLEGGLEGRTGERA